MAAGCEGNKKKKAKYVCFESTDRKQKDCIIIIKVFFMK